MAAQPPTRQLLFVVGVCDGAPNTARAVRCMTTVGSTRASAVAHSSPAPRSMRAHVVREPCLRPGRPARRRQRRPGQTLQDVDPDQRPRPRPCCTRSGTRQPWACPTCAGIPVRAAVWMTRSMPPPPSSSTLGCFIPTFAHPADRTRRRYSYPARAISPAHARARSRPTLGLGDAGPDAAAGRCCFKLLKHESWPSSRRLSRSASASPSTSRSSTTKSSTHGRRTRGRARCAREPAPTQRSSCSSSSGAQHTAEKTKTKTEPEPSASAARHGGSAGARFGERCVL